MGRIVLEKVKKSFGEVTVIPPLDLEINDGEFVVFVGPSGCGKSTLLRLIAGLEDVSGGTISIDGKDATQIPPAKRGLAMVFQSYALYPHMTVRKNIAFPLRMARLDQAEIDRRVANAASVLNLSDYIDRRPGQLSGGQRQRVAIGRAIVREPKLFLFDEPLSNLDAALRMNTRIEIADLHRTLSASMIYVTHDQTEAMTLADKIVVLRDGRVEQVGSPMELYNNPANQFVAGFLGSPSMNFLQKSATGLPAGATLGIRPEHLRIAESGRIPGEITHVENLGGDTNLLVRTEAGEILTVRLFGQYDATVGKKITLDYEDKDAFLFDQDQQRIR